MAAAFAVATLPAWGAGNTCPTFTGTYRLPNSEPAVVEAVDALGDRRIYSVALLKLEVSEYEGVMSVWVKSNDSRATMPTLPDRRLVRGADYRCADGWVELVKPVPAKRKLDDGFYEGRVKVRLAPAANGGLTTESTFTGTQVATLYSYDSARIAVPKLHTLRTHTDSVRWPDASEPLPQAVHDAHSPQARAKADVRQLLASHGVLDGVTVVAMQPRADDMLVTVRVPRRSDAQRFEAKLREVGLAYEVIKPADYSEGGYFMTLLVRGKQQLRPRVANAGPVPARGASGATR